MSPDNVIALWHQTRNHEKFKKLLKQQGFKYLGCGRNSTVFARDDVNFVVKIGRGCVTRKFKEPELEQFRLPYLYVNGNRNIGIQLRVRRDKKSKYRAFKRIQDATPPELQLYEYDIHQDNVGWLNRKPVIFDYK
jgi:hypothetical protein